MTSFCVHCLKKFEGRNTAQEFCSDEHRLEYGKAVEKERRTKRKSQREALRDKPNCLPGSRSIPGGRQAINFGSYDGREKDDYNQ